MPTIFHPTIKHSWYYNGPSPSNEDHKIILIYKQVQHQRLKLEVHEANFNKWKKEYIRKVKHGNCENEKVLLETRPL
jgi:hypothetical protein